MKLVNRLSFYFFDTCASTQINRVRDRARFSFGTNSERACLTVCYFFSLHKTNRWDEILWVVDRVFYNIKDYEKFEKVIWLTLM